MNKRKLMICIIAAAMALSSCAESKSADTSGSKSESQTAATDPAAIPENKTGVTVSFSKAGGFYSEGFGLELSCDSSDAEIHYTTDGSVPTQSSELYSGPIELTDRSGDKNVLSVQKDISADEDGIAKSSVTKANIIRAAAFDKNGDMGAVSSETYFIGIDREAMYGNAAVISLMTDMRNLFDYDTGIYTLGKYHDEWLKEDKENKKLEGWQHEANYTQRGREWERPVFCEYFSADGSVLFGQDMGMRIMGAASRNASQKSLRLTARSEYGEKNVKAGIIPDNMRSDGTGPVEKYKSFVLRNGGNDCDFGKIRDPFLQSMVGGLGFDTQQFTPAVVFLDGEFWGMYMLTEDYSNNYIENNYGVDKDNVVMIKTGEVEEGEESDYSLYSELYQAVAKGDMTDPEQYEKAEQMLDLRQFAEYCAFCIYINNEDCIFEGNNWRMWRARNTDSSSEYSDGKWRMLLYDTDFSTGIYSGGENYKDDTLERAVKSMDKQNKELEEPPADMFRSLLKNDGFKDMFVRALCDMRSINFEKEAVQRKLSAFSAEYSALIDMTYERFGPDWTNAGMGTYTLETFLNGRYGKFLDFVKKDLETSDPVTVTVNATEGGTVTLDGRTLDGSIKGEWFDGLTLSLTAQPDSGKKFVKWEISGGKISDETSDTAEVTLDGECTITAVFE